MTSQEEAELLHAKVAEQRIQILRLESTHSQHTENKQTLPPPTPPILPTVSTTPVVDPEIVAKLSALEIEKNDLKLEIERLR